MLGGCMKHKWFAFVIVMVICLSSVLVAVGAFSLFSKKTSQTTTAPIVNTPVNSGIYIQNASLLQNTATQNQTNLKITYTRWNAKGVPQETNQTYTDRVSVNYGDTVEFTITATQGYYIQSITTGNVGETLTQYKASSAIKNANMATYFLTTTGAQNIECEYQNDANATYTATMRMLPIPQHTK